MSNPSLRQWNYIGRRRQTVFYVAAIRDLSCGADESNRSLNRSIEIIAGDTGRNQISLRAAVQGEGRHCGKGYVSQHEHSDIRMRRTGNEMNEHFKAGQIRQRELRENAIDVLRSADV